MLIAPSLIHGFANYANHPVRSNIAGFLGRGTSKVHLASYSYAAFLSHAVMSLAVQVLVEAFSNCFAEEYGSTVRALAEPSLMAMFAGAMSVLLSWLLRWTLIEYELGVGKIVV